jgi:hypothetical protein
LSNRRNDFFNEHLTMNFNLTWHMSASQSNLTRLQAGDFAGGIRKITALEKRAGKAGNRHGCDLGVRLTN